MRQRCSEKEVYFKGLFLLYVESKVKDPKIGGKVVFRLCIRGHYGKGNG